MDEKLVLEINEPVNPTKEEFKTDGLTAPEVDLAKKHGLVKEEKLDADKVNPEPKTEDNIDGKKEVKPKFEELEKDEKLIDKYNANEKALYWKWKNDKRKRQEAQTRIDELQAEIELSKVKDTVSTKKLQQIGQLLKKDVENLTVEKLQEIIGDLEEIQEKDENAPLTISELKRIEQEKAKEQSKQQEFTKSQQERITITEKIGVELYPEFEQASKLAQEVVANDKTGFYQESLVKSFQNEDLDPVDLVERVMAVARLSPKFSELGKEKSEKKVEIKQEPRRVTGTAALSTGGGKRSIVEDDLTVEDAARLSTSQWLKLKKETRDRLLRG